MYNTIPATIEDYTINVDLYRLMVRHRVEDRSPLIVGEYSDVNLFTLNYQTAQDRYVSDGFTLEKVNSDNDSFHLRFNILYGSNLLGFVYTDRTKKYGYNLDIRPLHIDNRAFYAVNIACLLPRLLNAFGLSVSNHSQLDIAIDTQDADIAELIQHYTQQPDQYQRIKRRGDAGFKRVGELNELTGVTTYTTTFANARVTVKMYDKSKELASKPKDHITQFHVAHGFISDQPIYRVELSIKAKSLKSSKRRVITEDGEEMSEYKYKTAILHNNEDINGQITRLTDFEAIDLDISSLNSKGYLASLFAKFFPVEIRTTNSVKLSRCQQIQLINYNKYTMEDINIIQRTKETDNKLIKEKRSIKDNLSNFRKTGNPLFFEAAAVLSSLYQLHGYMNELIVSQRLNEFVARCGLQHLIEDPAIESRAYLTY